MIKRVLRQLFGRRMASKYTPYTTVVTALYKALLLRDPDDRGFRDKITKLRSGQLDFESLLNEMLSSQEFAMSLPLFGVHHVRGASMRFTNDVSQSGEVFELLRLIINQAAPDQWVVDVGARGLERSNSYDLMRHFGWRGLLVEANPHLIPSIEMDFANLNVRVVNCAVADREGPGVLTLGINDDVSSLNHHAAEGWGSTRGTVQIEMRRLPHILSEHKIPHDFSLLSLDIEGEDIAVLNDLVDNSLFRPRWIIIEASLGSRIHDLDDGPFSSMVRSSYELRWQNTTNLILGKRGSNDDTII